jgi:hypothetical protein
MYRNFSQQTRKKDICSGKCAYVSADPSKILLAQAAMLEKISVLQSTYSVQEHVEKLLTAYYGFLYGRR